MIIGVALAAVDRDRVAQSGEGGRVHLGIQGQNNDPGEAANDVLLFVLDASPDRSIEVERLVPVEGRVGVDKRDTRGRGRDRRSRDLAFAHDTTGDGTGHVVGVHLVDAVGAATEVFVSVIPGQGLCPGDIGDASGILATKRGRLDGHTGRSLCGGDRKGVGDTVPIDRVAAPIELAGVGAEGGSRSCGRAAVVA